MTAFYWLALNITRIMRLIIYRVHFTGKENIPKTGGYVVACNHRSLVDPVILAQGVSRQVYYMGKEELFHVPVLGPILRGAGVFPVSRGTGDMSAVEHAITTLREGSILGIFPEGTRSPDEHPGRFKSGMAHIAKSARVGVIPCAVIFTGKLSFWKKVEVRFGPPIPYEELFGEEESSAALKRATKLVKARITDMLGLAEATP